MIEWIILWGAGAIIGNTIGKGMRNLTDSSKQKSENRASCDSDNDLNDIDYAKFLPKRRKDMNGFFSQEEEVPLWQRLGNLPTLPTFRSPVPSNEHDSFPISAGSRSIPEITAVTTGLTKLMQVKTMDNATSDLVDLAKMKLAVDPTAREVVVTDDIESGEPFSCCFGLFHGVKNPVETHRTITVSSR